MIERIKTVAIIGAGTMGTGIAQVVAMNGFNVILYDVNAGAFEKALNTIRENLNRLTLKTPFGGISTIQRDIFLERIHTTIDIAEVSQADFVVEAAIENQGLKEELFQVLDRLCDPEVILASNTSSISINSLAEQTRRPEQIVGMHFMNPVPMMQLVEIPIGKRTSAATVNTVVALAKTMGKTPIKVGDRPGFVVNRILIPMINEAAYCLDEGVADAAGIDACMKLGAAHPMGPLTLADLIGLDVCLAIMRVLHRDLGDDKYKPSPLLEQMVADGLLGKKTRQGFYKYPAPAEAK